MNIDPTVIYGYEHGDFPFEDSMSTHWIESDNDFQYVVRDGVVTDIIEQDDGVTLHVTQEDSGPQKTLCVVFDKSTFPTVSHAKEWLASKSRQSDKRLFTKRAAYVTKKDLLGADGGPMRPTEAQLEKINQYTQSTKTADEVVAIPTLACNDLIDRDIEAFTPKSLRQMVALEGDQGIAGKSLMLSHNYSTLPTGRLFDAETTRRGGMNAVRIWTYVPNTDQYKSFIENIDYGLYWAVSVGLRLQSVTCSICKSPFDWWFNWFCENGHEKGNYYKPDEEDAKGSMARTSEDGALCYAKMENPIDFLELSVVFLGAQYAAQFEKNASFLKAASADVRDIPQLQQSYSLSNQVSVKADELDEVMGLMQGSSPSQIAKDVLGTALPAGIQNGFSTTDPGTAVGGLVKSTTSAVDPNTSYVINIYPTPDEAVDMAKSLLDPSTVIAGSGRESHEYQGGNGVSNAKLAALVLNVRSLKEQLELSAQELKKSSLSLRTATEGNEAVEALLGRVDDEIANLEAVIEAADEVAELDSDDEEAIDKLIEEGKSASGATVREIKAQFDALTLEREEDQKKIAELTTEVTELKVFAEAGEAYRDSLKNEIIETYRILQVGPGEPTGDVDATFIEGLVDKVQNDVGMLEHLKGDYERQLKDRYPNLGVIRSSAEENAEEIPGVTTGKNDADAKVPQTPSKSHRAVVGLHD